MFGFLFWLFLVGIIVASLQDLKRQEVDNWLTLFLIMASSVYLFYNFFRVEEWTHGLIFAVVVLVASFVFFFGDGEEKVSKKERYVSLFGFLVVAVLFVFILGKVFGFSEMPFFIVGACAFLVMFVVANLFYEGRVFAGGDAQLLFAMTVFFIGATFVGTLVNVGIFLLFLMLSGSVYGLIYSFVLYLQNYEAVNKKMRKGFDILWVRYVLILGVVLFVLSYVKFSFLIFAIFAFLLPLLYVFAKGLEDVSMVREVSGRELREGDWLVDDVRVGKKVVKADWDGLNSAEIKLLSGEKKVKIKGGLPFVPAFLIAFLGYVFLKDWFLNFLAGF